MPKGAMTLQEQIEQHVEKGVLGLVVLGLIYALFHWVFSSPRTVEVQVGGRMQELAPGEVDAALAEQARRIAQAVEDQEFNSAEQASSLDELTFLQTTPFLTDLSNLCAMTLGPAPMATVSDDTGGTMLEEIRQRSHITQVAQAPAVSATWVWYRTEDDSDKAALATGLATYPLEALRSEMAEILQRNPIRNIRVHVVGVEVQAQRLDGLEWVDVDADLVAAAPVAVPAVPAMGDLPELPEARAPVLEQWADQVDEIAQEILTPEFYRVYDADTGDYADWESQFDAESLAEANIYFHAVGLRPGAEYRYRYRLVLINPLYSRPDGVREGYEADTTVPLIETLWSEWSQPVSVFGLTEFYVSGANSNADSVNIAIVTQVLGQSIRADFAGVTAGDPIGGPQRVAVQLPGSGQSRVEEEDFSTGAILVDINFNKQTYSQGLPRTVTEVIYIDESGELQSRIRAMDQARFQREHPDLARDR
jgi:hypothetical protein